jgi:hypothetical protein
LFVILCAPGALKPGVKGEERIRNSANNLLDVRERIRNERIAARGGVIWEGLAVLLTDVLAVEERSPLVVLAPKEQHPLHMSVATG